MTNNDTAEFDPNERIRSWSEGVLNDLMDMYLRHELTWHEYEARMYAHMKAVDALAVPAQVEAKDFLQFLSDVMTAAGLVRHGKQSAALADRLSDGAVKYRFANPVEMSPEFTDTARSALLWVLWHQQGVNSEVSEAIRFALGMGSGEPLSDYQIREAKRYGPLLNKFLAEAEKAGVTHLAVNTPSSPALPPGWVPLNISFDGDDSEEVAYGPKHMMDRLKKWLDKFYEMRLAEKAGMVLAPHFRGYAQLGTGQYVINHSADLPAELIISIATEAEKAGRTVGEDRDNPPDGMLQPDVMAVRIEFTTVAGLDALEKQLRYLREVHFPESIARALPQPTSGN